MPNLTLVKQDAPAPAQVQAQAPSPASSASPPKPPSKQQIRSRIDELVKEGLSQADIASLLGISIAEVDLAMNLMNSKK